jgi:hypothetical protein
MVRDPGLPGMPRFDPDSGGNFALRVEAAGPALIGRTEMNVPVRGLFRGALAVKTEGLEGSSILLRVRILHDGEIAVERRFALERGPEPGGPYKRLPFSGEFMNDGAYTVEVRSSGTGAFWFDRLEIIR